MNTGLEKPGVKELMYKLITSLVSLVVYTNKKTLVEYRTHFNFNYVQVYLTGKSCWKIESNYMKPWGTSTLTGYYHLGQLLLKKDKLRPHIWLKIWLTFVKKTSTSHPIESLEYIKCYSSSSSRSFKTSSNLRYNCQKICSW